MKFPDKEGNAASLRGEQAFNQRRHLLTFPGK
jgi:hypothetical protein